MIKSKKWANFLSIVILCSAVVVRIVNLNGDAPAADISRSGEFYVDEGTYAHNVVNKILYGKWFIQDDYNAMSNVPVFTIFQYVLLKLFGISLVSLRYGGIIYITLSLIIFVYLFKKQDLTKAIIFLILGSFNYFLIIYNRMALLENLLILFLALISFCLFFYHEKKSIGWLIAATIFFWVGFFVKATILFFLPLLIGVIFIIKLPGRDRLHHLWIYSLVSSFLLLMIYLYWILPHYSDWHYFEGKNIHKMINESFLIFFCNYARYLTNLKLFQFMPITYLIFLTYISYLLYEFRIKKRLPFIEGFFLIWALCAILFLGFFKYSPPRHSLIIMPPIFFLTASFLVDYYRGNINIHDKKPIILFAPVIILSLCQIVFGFYRIFIYHQDFLSCYLPLLSIVFIPLLYYFLKTGLKKKMVAMLCFLMILSLNFFQIYRYYHHIQFSYYNAIQDMKNLIEKQNGEKNVLLGDIAHLVSVELKVKAVNIILRKETENMRILNNAPNLLVLQENNELTRLKDKIPCYFKNVELLKSYKIFNNYRNNDDTYLYSIENDFYDPLLVKK